MGDGDEVNEIVLYLPKPIILDKHRHYGSVYRPNDLYWGIGIEREFYLQSSKVQTVKRDWLLTNQRPERYSVRYFQSYKPETVRTAIENIYTESENIQLPILFNSHALYRCDRDGQHQTTYERVPKPNPYHDGKVIFEYMCDSRKGNNTFRRDYERSFCFDGDSIELTTQNFYKCTAEDAVDELQRLAANWISEANLALNTAGILKDHLPLRWATANHGLAVMWTNPKNLSIFNNGTYHINLTAPTRLDSAGRILDRKDFVARHKKIIRFFQWIEPLLIVKYGSGDVFSRARSVQGFSRGSLRCAMSRYIGVGTYDTDTMPNGKLLTVETETSPVGCTTGWYQMYHQESCYTALKEIGLDILFNKHFNHGVELRIFDWFPENKLYELLRILILCMDQALSLSDIPDPRKSRVWNKMCMRAVAEGCSGFKIWNGERSEMNAALGIRLRGFSCEELWTSLCTQVGRWAGRGSCATKMLRPQVGCCV
jgi:hypothetical protein